MRSLIFAMISIMVISCAQTKNKYGLDLPVELNNGSWTEYLKNAETKKDTCSNAVYIFSDLWISYKTPGTMNLLPGVDPYEYLAEIKQDLDVSKTELKKLCSISALLADIETLRKSGLATDYVISVDDYLSEIKNKKSH